MRQKEKGQGDTKRVWAIEMNEARDLYLKTYGGVDKIDQMLKEWGLDYITWRWWHAPMRHAKSLTYVMVYQMYVDCASGEVDPDWKLEKPMTHGEFRQKLGEQMCKYSAANLLYPGDERCTSYTRLSHKQRSKRKASALQKCADNQFRVSYEQYLDEKNPRGRDKISRLCGDDLDALKAHIRSFIPVATGICQVCGANTWKACGECEKLTGRRTYCCFKDKGGKGVSENMVSCCMDLHNDNYFGLCLNDRVTLFGERKSDFKKASKSEIKKNRQHIETLRKKMILDDMKQNGGDN